MDEILTPRPAATVLPLRDGPEGFEVLMLRRNLRSDFVGGAYVFPGGGVDGADTGPLAESLVVGLNDAQASSRLGLRSGGLAYYIACLRELFEEAGLLVVCDQHGVAKGLGDGPTIERMALNRRRVNDKSLGFLAMMREEELLLDLRALEYMAHWVTPVGPPRRFDTRFFVTLAPTGQVATHDAGETVADTWVRPVEALAALERGEFEMILPTIRNLEEIAHFETAGEVLEHARSKDEIPRIEPHIVLEHGEARILLPGDEGYEKN
jgi:8-oxo-dGTP pyrophosphatase MutT (NUDIX family)